MDPVQIDWNYQIKNKPNFLGQVKQINPVVGPLTGPILIVDGSTGLILAAGPTLSLALASLTQQGVIGTEGGQQLQGPLFFCGDPLSSTPPALIAPLPGAVMQNGSLGFYNDADGSLTEVKAQVSWDFNFSGSVLGLYSDEDAVIAGGGGGTGETAVLNNATLASITQRAAPFGTQLFDQAAISLELQAQGIAQILPSMTGPTWDFASEFGIQGAYSLEGGAFTGLYATDPVGNIFSGGLLTTVGTSSPAPTIGQPVGGSTPNELLYVDGSGNLGNTPGLTYTPGISGPIFHVPDGGTIIFDTITGMVHPIIFTLTGGGANSVVSADVFISPASDWVLGRQYSGIRLSDFFDPNQGISWTHAAAYNTPDVGIRRNSAGNLDVTDGLGTVYATLGLGGLNLTAGPVQVLGTAGNTFTWGAVDLAPSFTQAVPAPAMAYGSGAIAEYLGSPDTWVRVNIAGTDYVLPAYLP